MLVAGTGQAAKQSPQNQRRPALKGQAAKIVPTAPSVDGGQKIDFGCADGREDRHSDLCAQWKAADGASDAARYSWWQLTLGWVGLAFGAVTMAAAAAAAVFAKKAADETKRGADAAERSITETQRIGEAQVRCYITFVQARVKLSGRVPIFQIEIRNSGQSPATEMTAEYGYVSMVGQQHNPHSIALHKQDVLEDIGSQATNWMAAWHPPEALTLAQVELWKEGAPALALRVRVSGTDVFGKKFAQNEIFLCGDLKIGDGVFHKMGRFSEVRADARARVTELKLEGVL
jgi:hypothetical protein